MRPIARLALTLATALAASASFADEPKGDLAKLQGTWTYKVGPDKNIPITLTIKGNKFDVKIRREVQDLMLSGELKLDEKANPKTFDFVNFKTQNGDDLPDNLGIYKFDGDNWITCSGGPGNERPTKFEAGQDGPPNLSTWTKVKETEKPIAGDLGKFQGTWTAKAGANEEVEITMTVKANAYTASWESDGNKVELRGEIRLNDQATPNKTVDFFNTKRTDGEDARDNLGIYKIEGEGITVCVGGPGDERPTEFKRGSDGLPHLLVFTRKK